jgi:tetratricopeptide (TPR) repeat protein
VARLGRSGRALFAAAIFGVFTTALPACAQGTRAGLSAVDVFTAADQAKTAGRSQDALTLYEALTHDPDGEVRAEARFREGMLLAELKQFRQAAVAFRALLDEKPGATRVRLELARVLAAMGDESDARRVLRQAQAAGLPPEVALVVDQFALALRSTERVGGSLEIALAPDSNINRATTARTLDTIIAPLTLSQDARAQSGLGLKLSAQGFVRVPLKPSLAVVPRVSAGGSLYGKGEFDDLFASTQVGLEWRGVRDRVTPSIGPTWRWYGGKLYARTMGASLDWTHPVGRRTQVTATVSGSQSSYVTNALQDGALLNVGATVERALDAKSGIGGSLSATRQAADDPGYSTLSEGLTVFGWRELGRTTLVASGGIRRLDGDERLFLFPDRRREWLSQLSATATFRRLTIVGFAPLVRAAWEQNHSTVGIYTYRRLSVDVGIARAF